MKALLSLILFIAVLAPLANAHTYLTNLTINGTLLDEGKCIRPPWENENFPVKDVNSNDLRCRTKQMTTGSADICPVAAGSVVTVDMHESGFGSRFISDSHRGPCLVYMAPLESNGEGNVWFKIYEDGWDSASDTWCVNKVISTNGKLDVTIPADIVPGNYLLRTEIIALHEANRVYGADADAGAELFPNCAQLAVYGAGKAVPSGVAIPGAYNKEDPGLFYDLWGDSTTYEIPGPTVYTAGSIPVESVTSDDLPVETVIPSALPVQPVNKVVQASGRICKPKSSLRRRAEKQRRMERRRRNYSGRRRRVEM